MSALSRRTFLKKSTGLAALGISAPFIDRYRNKPLLSFSTLGCPDWPFPEIVRFAAAHQYNGLEMRGILREMDLMKCKAFSNRQNIDNSMKLMEDNHLRFVDLGSSAQLHHREAALRQSHLDEARRFIDLAAQLKCPYVRVFPNSLPKDEDKTRTMELIADGLNELVTYANGSEVTVLMETHGDLVHSDDLVKVMQLTNQPATGLIWDIVNMWSITKEAPSAVYPKLKQYIRHTHIKDMTWEGEKIHYVLLGEGQSPIFEGIDALAKGGYQGYYSFEWEKMWHPEIAAPELALAQFPKAMEKHFA